MTPLADVVLSVVASHAPGLAGLYAGAPESTKADVDKMYGAMEAEIAAADLDVLILIGNDHLANSKVLEYPDFLVGMAEEHTGPFDGFQTRVMGPGLLRAMNDEVTAHLVDVGRDPAGFPVFSEEMTRWWTAAGAP